MGLAEVLRVVVGLTGEPDIDVAAQLEQTNGFALGWQLETAIQNLTHDGDLRGYQYGLLQASRQAEERANSIRNAQTIQSVLPAVEEIIKNWTDNERAPRGEDGSWGPIHVLQSAFNINNPDGVFGPATARALLDHQIEAYNNNFEHGRAVDLQVFRDTYFYSIIAAPAEARLFDAAASSYEERQALQDDLTARIEQTNAFIREEFSGCVNEAADFDVFNPFQEILAAIPPLAQIAEEEEKAHEQIANAIHLSCSRFLEQVDINIREELVAGVAARIEPVLRQAITQRVDAVNREAIERLLLEQRRELTPEARGRDAAYTRLEI